jgi:hypothetical protein
VDRADDIWNRAALGGGGGTRAGDLALSAVLKLHGLAMSGGLVDAIERLTPAEADAAEAGYRWLGLGPAADVVASVRREVDAGALDDDERAEALELRADEEYGHVIPADDTLESALRTRLAAEPDAFSST